MTILLDSKTKAKLYERLVTIVGEEHVTQLETDRVLNAHDAWPLSQAKIRAGEMLPLADMIVFPASSEEVSQILIVANDLEVPVIPVGGGAGTCGGTLAIYGGVQVDLKRMCKILDIDPWQNKKTAVVDNVLQVLSPDIILPSYPFVTTCYTPGRTGKLQAASNCLAAVDSDMKKVSQMGSKGNLEAKIMISVYEFFP